MSKKHNQVRSSQSEVSTAVLDHDAENRMMNVLARADSKVTPKAESVVKELISDVISGTPAKAPAEEKPAEITASAPEPEKPVSTEKLNLRTEMKKLISTGTMTQKEILTKLHEMFPAILSATISTILSDSKNIVYNKFEFQTKITEDGKYAWSDQKSKLFKSK